MAPDSDQSYLIMRVSPNGRASAFQADDASSIPATRSRVSWRSDPTRLPVEEEIAGLNPAGTATKFQRGESFTRGLKLKAEEALLKLVLALGHSIECAALGGPACTCGKVGRLRDAHGEACSLLREAGHLK